VEALHRVPANADADRDEGAEAAMYARAKLDPFLWRLRAEGCDASRHEQKREKSDHPEMQVHRGTSLVCTQFRSFMPEAAHRGSRHPWAHLMSSHPGQRAVVIFGNTSNESQLRPIVAMLHCY
jgi:hypothetical protein